MKVIGIDVGPAKGGHICDGESVIEKTPQELEKHLDELRKNKDILIAWDAPLTGPADPEADLADKDLSCRKIENFFMRGENKPPEGVSVQPYSGCAHWTISRRMLGLPRIGKFDMTEVPFKLASREEDKPKAGAWVVEVHPAVALWIWCKEKHGVNPWNYKNKKDPECRRALAGLLQGKLPSLLEAKNDDEFDAWLAWYLANQWIENDPEISLWGNAATGSFLLPYNKELKDRFDAFVR